MEVKSYILFKYEGEKVVKVTPIPDQVGDVFRVIAGRPEMTFWELMEILVDTGMRMWSIMGKEEFTRKAESLKKYSKTDDLDFGRKLKFADLCNNKTNLQTTNGVRNNRVTHYW